MRPATRGTALLVERQFLLPDLALLPLSSWPQSKETQIIYLTKELSGESA